MRGSRGKKGLSVFVFCLIILLCVVGGASAEDFGGAIVPSGDAGAGAQEVSGPVVFTPSNRAMQSDDSNSGEYVPGENTGESSEGSLLSMNTLTGAIQSLDSTVKGIVTKPTLSQEIIQVPQSGITGIQSNFQSFQGSDSSLTLSLTTEQLNTIAQNGLQSAPAAVPGSLQARVDLGAYIPHVGGEAAENIYKGFNFYDANGKKLNDELLTSGDSFFVDIAIPGKDTSKLAVNKNLNEDVLSIGTSQKYSTAQTFYMKAENLAGSESDTATPIYVTFDKTFQFNYVNNDPLYGQVDKLVDPTNPEIKSLAGKLQFKQDSESCWLAYKNSGVTFEITNNSASSDSTRTVSQIFENGTGNTKDWARVAASTLIAMGVDAKVKSGTVSCNKYGSGSNYNTWWVEFSRQNGDKMETYVTANLPFKGVVYMTKKDFQDAKF